MLTGVIHLGGWAWVVDCFRSGIPNGSRVVLTRSRIRPSKPTGVGIDAGPVWLVPRLKQRAGTGLWQGGLGKGEVILEVHEGEIRSACQAWRVGCAIVWGRKRMVFV